MVFQSFFIQETQYMWSMKYLFERYKMIKELRLWQYQSVNTRWAAMFLCHLILVFTHKWQNQQTNRSPFLLKSTLCVRDSLLHNTDNVSLSLIVTAGNRRLMGDCPLVNWLQMALFWLQICFYYKFSTLDTIKCVINRDLIISNTCYWKG